MIAANKDVNIKDLSPELKCKIDELETELKREVICTSGYRDPSHPIESVKSKPGEHAHGNAVDLAAIGGHDTYVLIQAAIKIGFERIGVNRKASFVHLGIGYPGAAPKTLWTY